MCKCRGVNKKHRRSSEGIEKSKEAVEILCYTCMVSDLGCVRNKSWRSDIEAEPSE